MNLKPKNDPRNHHDDDKDDRNAWETPEDDDIEDDEEDDDDVVNRIELPGRSCTREMWVLRGRRKLAEIGAHGGLMPMQHPSRQSRRAWLMP